MRYAITHLTRFAYDRPISDSHMEVRLRPLTDDQQTCLYHEVQVSPRARVLDYRDHLGNAVDYFSVPDRHDSLTITARADVVVAEQTSDSARLERSAWQIVDEWAARDAYWDLSHPSGLATWSSALLEYAATIPQASGRALDPLSTVRAVLAAVHRDIEYAPNSTRVDSTVDEVLASRRGVCQDFSHLAIALLRRFGLPARYVSGYLAPVPNGDAREVASATHAWIEVLLPQVGWTEFDPTHHSETGPRHIRIAVGRDYADVPPTRGVFKGGAASTLAVAIVVSPAGGDRLPEGDADELLASVSVVPSRNVNDSDGGNGLRQRQEQQQQQLTELRACQRSDRGPQTHLRQGSGGQAADRRRKSTPHV
jgi:transglutaminase-like putative cysteine protease